MNQTKQLNRENNRLDEQLDGEYESVMTDLVCYLRGVDITDGQAERVRRDLLEMFIAAKERGEDVQTLIGGDYRQFCNAILENVPRRAFRGVSSDAVYRIPYSGAVPPTLSFQMPVQQFCGFSVHGGVIVVAYLKKIHVLLRFEIGSLRVPENSIHSISDCQAAVRYAVMC